MWSEDEWIARVIKIILGNCEITMRIILKGVKSCFAKENGFPRRLLK